MKFTRLAEKLKNIGLDFELANAADPEIKLLVSDSRKAGDGAVFACVKGGGVDGHDFAGEAVKRGACALMCERRLEINVPQIVCRDVRKNMGHAASELYGRPADKLKLAAITGTAGKTTSTFMLKSILDAAGMKCGLIGTVYYDDGGLCEKADRTTPEADVVQLKLKNMTENGCKACVMEASSHAITQGRLTGCGFDAAGFTNLSQEHLDYHKSMKSYFEAKRLLFKNYMRGAWKAGICADNEYGLELYGEFKNNSVLYSLKNETADYFARVKKINIEGMEAEIKTPYAKGFIPVRLPVIGEYNMLNALQALCAADILGIDSRAACESLSGMPQIPGRLEKYVISGGGACVIDFAHTPDEIEKVLSALRSVCEGRLITAFGAGGDRDKTKRRPMGEAAARLSDHVIITTDNPRGEDPDEIIGEIEAGARQLPASREKIADRKEAIYKGLSMLKPGDIFAVLGKGPESFMEIKGEKRPFLDKNVLLEWCLEYGREIK